MIENCISCYVLFLQNNSKTKWLIQQTISKLQELTMSIACLYK